MGTHARPGSWQRDLQQRWMKASRSAAHQQRPWIYTSPLRLSALVGSVLGLRQNEGDNQTVQTKRLAENENQNHADKQLRLLPVRTHTGVTNNTNSKAGGQRRETARQTSGEVGKAVEARVRRLDCNREKEKMN